MNIDNLILAHNNAIQRKISEYDNESIIDLNIDDIAKSIVTECSIPTDLELSTDDLSSSTRMVEIPTKNLSVEMRLGATKPSCRFVAVDYHITVRGNKTLLNFLPIIRHDNVKVDDNCITLTLVLDYVRLVLPDEKIKEVKQQLKLWLQKANQEISALLAEINDYNSSLKEAIKSKLKEIQDRQRRLKEQNDKLSQID